MALTASSDHQRGDDDGDGDEEDDEKENAGHLVPVEHHIGLSRKDGD